MSQIDPGIHNSDDDAFALRGCPSIRSTNHVNPPLVALTLGYIRIDGMDDGIYHGGVLFSEFKASHSCGREGRQLVDSDVFQKDNVRGPELLVFDAELLSEGDVGSL